MSPLHLRPSPVLRRQPLHPDEREETNLAVSSLQQARSLQGSLPGRILPGRGGLPRPPGGRERDHSEPGRDVEADTQGGAV